MKPNLRFARSDVLKLRFDELNSETALETLLAVALKGGGMLPDAASEEAAKWIGRKGEGEAARLLERAATDALNRERETARLRRQEYTAWRIGYYISKAMGTWRDYPPRP